MDQVTFAQLADKVELDLDLQEEDFVTRKEILGYANEALHEAESIILRLCEDYFLDSALLTLVPGQADYAVPTKFFGDKIRHMTFAVGTRIFPVIRYRKQGEFEDIAVDAAYPTATDSYRYKLLNTLESGRVIRIYPTPQVASGGVITVWGIRSCRKLVLETDLVDIPEFHAYLEQFMKVRCYEKEGHPNLGVAIRMLEAYRDSMTQTLSNRFPDNDDQIEADYSFYSEHN